MRTLLLLPLLTLALLSSTTAQRRTIGGLAPGDAAASVDSILRLHGLIALAPTGLADSSLGRLPSGAAESRWRIGPASGIDAWLDFGCVAPMAAGSAEERGEQVCASTSDVELRFVGDRLQSLRLLSRALPSVADTVRLHTINLFIHLRGIATAGPTEEHRSPWGLGDEELSTMGAVMPIATWRVRRERGGAIELLLTVERTEGERLRLVVEMRGTA